MKLCHTRVTTGKFLNDGEEFKIVDDYTHFQNAHRNLRSGWIGTSEFTEVVMKIPAEPESGAQSKQRVSWADIDDDNKEVELSAHGEAVKAGGLSSLTLSRAHNDIYI